VADPLGPTSLADSILRFGSPNRLIGTGRTSLIARRPCCWPGPLAQVLLAPVNSLRQQCLAQVASLMSGRYLAWKMLHFRYKMI
jgi:hypothetical protein